MSIRRRRKRNGASQRYFQGNRRLAPCRSLPVHVFGQCLLSPAPVAVHLHANGHCNQETYGTPTIRTTLTPNGRFWTGSAIVISPVGRFPTSWKSASSSRRGIPTWADRPTSTLPISTRRSRRRSKPRLSIQRRPWRLPKQLHPKWPPATKVVSQFPPSTPQKESRHAGDLRAFRSCLRRAYAVAALGNPFVLCPGRGRHAASRCGQARRTDLPG